MEMWGCVGPRAPVIRLLVKSSLPHWLSDSLDIFHILSAAFLVVLGESVGEQ